MRRALRWCKYPLLAVVVLSVLVAAAFAYYGYVSRMVFVDKAGRAVSSPEPSTARAYWNTANRLRAENGEPGFGETRVGYAYEDGIWEHFGKRLSFSEGPRPVCCRDAVYYVDQDGRVQATISPGVRGEVFSEGLAAVATILVPASENVHEGDANPCLAERGWGFIDNTGKFVIPPSFNSAGPFRDGLAPVETDKGFGFVDKTGAFAIQPRFSGARPFGEGLAAVCVDGKWGFVDKSGALVIEAKFAEAGSFSEGMAAVADPGSGDDTRWGYIDKSGAFVIPPRFCEAARLSEGLAAVAVGGGGLDQRWGYVDKAGAFQIEAKYRLAAPFRDGAACVVPTSAFVRAFEGVLVRVFELVQKL